MTTYLTNGKGLEYKVLKYSKAKDRLEVADLNTGEVITLLGAKNILNITGYRLVQRDDNETQ